MKQDRFLIGILVFIGLLVLAALALFFLRQDGRSYGPEDTPQGVVYNYVLAVQRKDYKRAYGYLADAEGKPAYAQFLQNFQYFQDDAALEIHSTRQEADMTWVDVTLHYMGNGPFDSGWSQTDSARLVEQDGLWKLTYMVPPYWGYEWYQQMISPAKP